MSASGTVTVRFDVQGNEKLLQTLITTATGSEKLNTSMVKLQSTLGGIGVGNLGPLNNLATSVKNSEAAMGSATTKIATFKEKLAGIGTQLGSNATSFGVATASIWGVYNAYDSLEKVQIRAHAAATKVQTLETSLAALTERRRLAVAKGNITNEQLAILNEKITNTTEKLSVAQERNADVAQDVQEAWAGFFSTVGPQAIAATGSIIQLGTVFKSTFAPTGGFINTVKNAFISLIPSLAKARAESLLLSPALGGLPIKADQASTAFGKLKGALGGIGVGGGLALGGLAAAGGLLIALAVDTVNTANKVRELQVALKGLEVGSSAAFTNLAQQAKTFNQSLTGQIGGLLADSNKTIFGTTPIIGFNMREVFKKRLDEDTNTIKADIAKNLEAIMSGATATLAGDISPATKANIDKGIARIKQYLVDSSGKNFATPESTINTFDVIAKGAGAQLQKSLEDLPKLIAGGNVDISGLMTKQTAQVQQFAQAIVKDLGGATKAAAVPAAILSNNIDLLIQSMIEGGQVTPELANAIKSAVSDIIKANNDLSGTFATITKTVGVAGVGIRHMGDAIAYTTAQTDPFNTTLVKDAGLFIDTTTKADYLSGAINAQGKEVSDASTKYVDLQKGLSMYMDTSNASIGELENWTTMNNKTIKSITEQRAAITDNISFWERMTKTTFDAAIANNKWITAHTNVTKILDGSRESVLAFSNAEKEGTIAAQEWFTSMVLGTVKTETMTKAVADSAKAVGIHADMMAFSAGKAQELITTTYEMSTAFSDEALAASKSTAFLKDKVAIDAQIKAGMIDGRQAANDWAASLDKSTAAGKAEHDQLLHLTADMINLPVPMSLTNDQLKEVMTNFKLTGDAAGSLSDVMSSTLGPSFEHLKGLFDATSMKDFKNALKDLSISKDLKGDLKDMGKSLVDLAKNRKGAQDTFDVLLQFGDEILKKHPKDWAKFVGDLADKLAKGAGKKGLTEDMKQFLDTIRTMSPDDLQAHAESVQMFIDAFDPKSEGGKKITSGEWEKILTKFNEEAKLVGPSAQGSVPGIDSLNTSMGSLSKSVGGAAKSLGEFASAQLDIGKSSPLTNLFLSQQKPDFGGGKDKTTEITPPAPLVFPPPDMHNITDAIKKIEVDIGSMVDFAANLVLTLPPMNIDAVNEGLTTAEENLGSIIDFVSGLTLAFPPMNIDAVNTGVTEAEVAIGSVATFIGGMTMAFLKPNTQPVLFASTQANTQIKTVQTTINGLKLVFQKPDIRGVITSCDAAVKRMLSLEGVASGLKLKFPKPDISQIESAVSQAQSKIDSLHGTTVTNHVKTVFDSAGGNILNDVKIMSAAAGKLFTTNGEQLFRVGDNPGGRETVAMIPHDKPGPIMDRLNKMFSNVYSTIHERARRPSIQSISGGGGNGISQRSGPTVVNVTTEVYLFPGSDMFKKFVKSIMLEEMSRYASV